MKLFDIVMSFRLNARLRNTIDERREKLSMSPGEYIRHCIRLESGEV